MLTSLSRPAHLDEKPVATVEDPWEAEATLDSPIDVSSTSITPLQKEASDDDESNDDDLWENPNRR